MVEVTKTPEFDKWLTSLRDSRARAKVIARIRRLSLGNPGDVRPIGQGASEMRIDYGPGYRVYYKQTGNAAAILYAGEKAGQSKDIATALDILKSLET